MLAVNRSKNKIVVSKAATEFTSLALPPLEFQAPAAFAERHKTRSCENERARAYALVCVSSMLLRGAAAERKFAISSRLVCCIFVVVAASRHAAITMANLVPHNDRLRLIVGRNPPDAYANCRLFPTFNPSVDCLYPGYTLEVRKQAGAQIAKPRLFSRLSACSPTPQKST